MMMKSLKYCENYQNMTKRHEVSKCSWKNGASRLVQLGPATDLQFVRNTSASKCKKGSTIKQGVPVLASAKGTKHFFLLLHGDTFKRYLGIKRNSNSEISSLKVLLLWTLQK